METPRDSRLVFIFLIGNLIAGCATIHDKCIGRNAKVRYDSNDLNAVRASLYPDLDATRDYEACRLDEGKNCNSLSPLLGWNSEEKPANISGDEVSAIRQCRPVWMDLCTLAQERHDNTPEGQAACVKACEVGELRFRISNPKTNFCQGAEFETVALDPCDAITDQHARMQALAMLCMNGVDKLQEDGDLIAATWDGDDWQGYQSFNPISGTGVTNTRATASTLAWHDFSGGPDGLTNICGKPTACARLLKYPIDETTLSDLKWACKRGQRGGDPPRPMSGEEGPCSALVEIYRRGHGKIKANPALAEEYAKWNDHVHDLVAKDLSDWDYQYLLSSAASDDERAKEDQLFEERKAATNNWHNTDSSNSNPSGKADDSRDSDSDTQAEIQNIQAGVQQAQQANDASNEALANAQQQINATVQSRAARQAAQAQAAQAEQQRLAQERQHQLAAQQKQLEEERQRAAQEAERQRQAAAEQKKNLLHDCLQQAQGFRLTYTDPWIARAQGLIQVITLEIDNPHCKSESWAKCWREIKGSAFMPSMARLQKWAKEMDEIDREFESLPLNRKKECDKKCKETGCYNQPDILQLRFWCRNGRDNCVQQLTTDAGELQNASRFGTCVWTESTIWNQENRCQSLYGAGQ